ncbi:MAG: NADH-quinone oxidoreductase subunit K [Asgard group archaeon]|nr:NADH-quinone oxidoreductase subunit K [Candidatus Heimdallarchaeota archaeon]MCK5185323.1 NADH-quinone oxidoreductase subunit K [Candidatus Heimdallarchaeota archaeon]NPE07666.1 NADH-quinone oxidoreductase subunit K [Asgard group archaeon]
MSAIPFDNIYIILAFSVALLAIGIYALTTKQNMIKFLIAIELLLDAGHLNFIAFSNIFSTGVVVDPLPHAVVILSICVGGCVAGVALALIIQAYRIHATLNSRRLNQLKY